MMNALLAVDYTKPLESIGDKLALSGQMLAMGLGVVFAVLLLLWGFLELFHFLVATLPATDGFKRFVASLKGESAPEAEKKPEPAKPAAPAPAPAAPAATSDTELVAAITAAIAASENAPVGSFRVVSFRRV